MSKLLIDEKPLEVLPKLATKIGLNKSIFLQQLHYWLNKSKNIKDGKKWVYNTYADWKENNFPFWSESTIGRIVRELEEDHLIISKKFQEEDWDQTKWYSLNYHHEIFDDTNLTHSSAPDEDDLNRNTETTTETTTDINGKSKKSSDDILGKEVLDRTKRMKQDDFSAPDIQVDLSWLEEPLHGYARAFIECYDREPYDSTEQDQWAAAFRKWQHRHVTPSMVKKAYKWHREEGGKVVKSPHSITYAFDEMRLKQSTNAPWYEKHL